MKHRIISFVACILFLFSAYSALACSCGSLPVCEAYGSAKAVFVGKVVDGKAAERMSEMFTAQTKDLTFKLSVSRAFIGVKKGEIVDIHTGFGFGDCGFPFEKGEEYVVYAIDRDGKLETGICSRTRHISRTDEELTNIEALSLSNGASVSGRVTRYDQSSLIGEPFTPLRNKTIKLVRLGSGKTYASVTDKNGDYEFTRLPTGLYRLEFDVEPGWELDDYETKDFHLNKHGCAYKSLSLENDSRVKGIILDPDGKPVPDVWVEFVPLGVSRTINNDLKEFSPTDADGEIGWFNLPPGKYTASINFLNAANEKAPFPATFAPGVLERDKARIIEIKPGSKINDIVIRIPKRLDEQTISGAVVWPDGTPAKGALVFLLDTVREDVYVDDSVDTDAEGRFQKTGYAGRKYKIHIRAEKKIGDQSLVYRAETDEFSADGPINQFRIVVHPSDE